jgi:hypothetical protein
VEQEKTVNTIFIAIIMELAGCEMDEGGRLDEAGCSWELSGQSMKVWNLTSTLSMCLLDVVHRNGESLTWLLLL